MLLKKQTVWLLTMLSLVVVLSVYYITSPEQQQNELAAIDETEETTEQPTEGAPETEGTVEQETAEEVPEGTVEQETKEEATGEATEKTGEDAIQNISKEDAEIITNAAGDEVFETLRMQMQDERSQLKEELEQRVGSTELSAEERSQAKERMDELNEIAQKEVLLETLIKAMNYEDVLVQADDEEVTITVKAEKQSKAEANKIIQTVRSELGPLHAVVEFQTAE
jgi:stage III sporulation protein AH